MAVVKKLQRLVLNLQMDTHNEIIHVEQFTYTHFGNIEPTTYSISFRA